jgi:hypothetical protein
MLEAGEFPPSYVNLYCEVQVQVPVFLTRQPFLKGCPGFKTGGVVILLSLRFISSTKAIPSTQATGVDVPTGTDVAVAAAGDVGVNVGKGGGTIPVYSSIKVAKVPSAFIEANAVLI